MAIVQNKIIHRFIRPISEYEEGGLYFNKIIPVDTQAFAYYPIDSTEIKVEENSDSYSGDVKVGLYYVLGDGNHTYTEIRDGKGSLPSAKEYPVLTQEDVNEKIDTLIAGANVVISGYGPYRKISVPGIAVPDRFTTIQDLPLDLELGDEIKDLDGSVVMAINPPASLKVNDIVIFTSNHQATVTYVDPAETLYDAVITFVPAPQDRVSFENLKGDPYDNIKLANVLDDKLDKNNTPNSLYAIDKYGNQVIIPIKSAGIKDAPKDDKQYARINGTWQQVAIPNIIDDTISSVDKTYSSYKIDEKFNDVKVTIENLSILKIEIVDELPSIGKEKTLYLMLNGSSTVKDIYNEYLWIDGKYELIGNTNIDLSMYATKDMVKSEISLEKERAVAAELALSDRIDENSRKILKNAEDILIKQDILIPGKNITIENNIISATSSVVSVNEVLPDDKGNIQIDKADIGLSNVENTADLDKPISKATLFALNALNEKVDTKQDKLTAGANITISPDNVISAVSSVVDVNGVRPNENGSIILTKADIGLGNVDNTADLDKPVSNATSAAISELNSVLTSKIIEEVDRATAAEEVLRNSLIETNKQVVINKEEIAKKQDKLIPGKNITIIDNVIAAEDCDITYPELQDKPSINGVELVGNKTLDELNIQIKGDYPTKEEVTNEISLAVINKPDRSELASVAFTGQYSNLSNKPSINNVELVGNKTLDELNIQIKGDYVSKNTYDTDLAAINKNFADLDTDIINLNNDITDINSDIIDVKSDISNINTKLNDIDIKKQDKLIAGDGISIENNIISVIDKIESYVDLTDKPSINNIELVGNKTLDELNIQVKGNYATVQSLNDEINRAISSEQYLNTQIETNKEEIITLTSAIVQLKEDVAKKQNKLIAGYGIKIENDVISVWFGDESGDESGEESNYPEESSSGSDSGSGSGSYGSFSGSFGSGSSSSYLAAIYNDKFEDLKTKYIAKSDYDTKCKNYENELKILNNKLDYLLALLSENGLNVIGLDSVEDF